MKAAGSSGLLWLVLGSLGGLVFAPGTARATSCATNYVLTPGSGDANVPTDTLLWGYAGDVTRLLGPAGNVLDTEERKLPIRVSGGSSGILPVLVPLAPLEPNTDHTIEIDSGSEYPAQRVVFTTGAGPARGAPAVPVLLSSEPRMGAGSYAAGVVRGVLLRFDFDGIVIGDTGELGDIATIDALFEQGDTNLAAPNDPALPMIQWVSHEAEVWAGLAECAVWPRGASDAELGRFGVLDLAGNFSGWASVPLELPSRAEAEVAAAADREARRTHNVQQGRPPACSLDLPGGEGAGPNERSRVLCALALGLAAAGARRARRAQ